MAIGNVFKKLMTDEEFIVEAFEIAFGYDSINRGYTKSEVLETIMDDIDPQTIAEVFLTGCCFGVLEYMAKEQSKQKYDKEAMLNAIKNMKEDISPLLDVDKFIYAMKNEENDF